MNKYISLTVVLSTALGVGACSQAANTNVVVQTANSGNTNTTANMVVNAAANTVATSDAPAAAAPGSPTEVYKIAHYARQKKDIATLKKIFSKDILAFFTDIGKIDKKSLDDELREMCEKAEPGDPEVRNEKITGDKATLEYKEEGEWKTVDFVKEDGVWKMTTPKAEGPDGGKGTDKETKEKK